MPNNPKLEAVAKATRVVTIGHDLAVRECDAQGGCGYSPCIAGQLYDAENALGRLYALYLNGPGPEGCGETIADVRAAVDEVLDLVEYDVAEVES